MNERVWVDLENCKKLTDNISTIFNTKSADDKGCDHGVVAMETGSSHPSGDEVVPAVVGEYVNCWPLISSICTLSINLSAVYLHSLFNQATTFGFYCTL